MPAWLVPVLSEVLPLLSLLMVWLVARAWFGMRERGPGPRG